MSLNCSPVTSLVQPFSCALLPLYVARPDPGNIGASASALSCGTCAPLDELEVLSAIINGGEMLDWGAREARSQKHRGAMSCRGWAHFRAMPDAETIRIGQAVRYVQQSWSIDTILAKKNLPICFSHMNTPGVHMWAWLEAKQSLPGRGAVRNHSKPRCNPQCRHTIPTPCVGSRMILICGVGSCLLSF
jgi:hypothetical protein